MSRLTAVVCSLAVLATIASSPAAAVQRVFVASFGSDANTANNCSFANPCRGFTAAMTMVDSGGEVVALDAAGYGAVTITKSVTITANPGFYAGISAATGNAVTIATAGVKVTLRGLNINGTGANSGVVMTNGERLAIENCVISNFNYAGVHVAVGTVRILDSVIRDNYEGVQLDGGTASITGTKMLGNTDAAVLLWGASPGVTTTVAVSDSIMTGNTVGVAVANTQVMSTAYASVSRSTLSNNQQGVLTSSLGGGTSIVAISGSLVTGNSFAGLNNVSGTIRSQGNNTVDFNSTNTMGTITAMPGM